MSYHLTIREMTIDDVPMLKIKEVWMYDRYLKYITEQGGPAYVIEEEGQLLCAFGALFEWPQSGVCDVWFNIIEHKRTFNIARIFKRLLVRLAAQYKVTRMQAVVRCDSEVNSRFMKFLGFINETPFGMKNKLPDGEGAYLFARCFQWDGQ